MGSHMRYICIFSGKLNSVHYLPKQNAPWNKQIKSDSLTPNNVRNVDLPSTAGDTHFTIYFVCWWWHETEANKFENKCLLGPTNKKLFSSCESPIINVSNILFTFKAIRGCLQNIYFLNSRLVTWGDKLLSLFSSHRNLGDFAIHGGHIDLSLYTRSWALGFARATIKRHLIRARHCLSPLLFIMSDGVRRA